MGGKDPGTYMNEGIQIAQHGSLAIHDRHAGRGAGGVPRACSSPATQREDRSGRAPGRAVHGLLRRRSVARRRHGPVSARVPGWIAIGYGLDGLTRRQDGPSARGPCSGSSPSTSPGRGSPGASPAFIGTLLLAINVADVWYARYPNSEVMQQALLFAALPRPRPRLPGRRPVLRPGRRACCSARSCSCGSIRWSSSASSLRGLLLLVADGKRPGWSFFAPLAVLLAAAAAYFAGPLQAYLAIPMMQVGGCARALGVALAALPGRRHRDPPRPGRVTRRGRGVAALDAARPGRRRRGARGLRVLPARTRRAASPRTMPMRSACSGGTSGRSACWPPSLGIRRAGVDAVLERSRAAHRGRARVRLLLLQDPHRARSTSGRPGATCRSSCRSPA